MASRSRGTAFAFLAPSLLCLAGVVGYPLVQAVTASLYRWNLVSGRKRWAGLQNYFDTLQDPETARVAVVTLVYTGLSVGLELGFAFALALLFRYGLVRRLRGFPLLRVVLCVPVVIAPLIWAFYFRSMYSPQFGAFNAVLGLLGVPPIPWVNSPTYALYSLVIADAWQWTPFMFAIILAGLLTSPSEVIEAARIDGATWLQALWWIELPLLRPILMVAVLLRLIDSIKNLDLVLVITQGGPGTSTEILNFFAYSASFQSFQVGAGSALAIIVLILIMILVSMLLAVLRRLDRAGRPA